MIRRIFGVIIVLLSIGLMGYSLMNDILCVLLGTAGLFLTFLKNN